MMPWSNECRLADHRSPLSFGSRPKSILWRSAAQPPGGTRTAGFCVLQERGGSGLEH